MKVKSLVKKSSKVWKLIAGAALIGFAGLCYAKGGLDPSTDMLTSAKADVTNNFGPTSSFAYILYTIEVIAGIAAYIKSKNLFALLGIVVVVIFTSVAFTLIGS